MCVALLRVDSSASGLAGQERSSLVYGIVCEIPAECVGKRTVVSNSQNLIREVTLLAKRYLDYVEMKCGKVIIQSAEKLNPFQDKK